MQHASFKTCAVTLALAAAFSVVASANIVVFDETRDGDASDDRFATTIVALSEGVNTLRGF